MVKNLKSSVQKSLFSYHHKKYQNDLLFIYRYLFSDEESNNRYKKPISDT